MRVRKFNENEIQNISSDRVQEIISEISELSVLLDSKFHFIDSMMIELQNFQDVSNKSNDQIDDVVIDLQIVKKSLGDSVSKLDDIITILDDYRDNGRKFLY